MLTAPVGITVKGMETKKKQTSVMQGFTVLLVKRFGIPMVWSVLLGISVLLVLKNQSGVTVELTRIQSIKCLVRYAQRDSTVIIAMHLWCSTRIAPVPQVSIAQMALHMHLSSHVLWGHSAMSLVYLMSLSVVHALVVITVMNWGRQPSPRNVIKDISAGAVQLWQHLNTTSQHN